MQSDTIVHEVGSDSIERILNLTYKREPDQAHPTSFTAISQKTRQKEKWYWSRLGLLLAQSDKFSLVLVKLWALGYHSSQYILVNSVIQYYNTKKQFMLVHYYFDCVLYIEEVDD